MSEHTADATGTTAGFTITPQQTAQPRSSSCPYCTPRCPHGFIADPVRPPYITWGGYHWVAPANPAPPTFTYATYGNTENQS